MLLCKAVFFILDIHMLKRLIRFWLKTSHYPPTPIICFAKEGAGGTRKTYSHVEKID